MTKKGGALYPSFCSEESLSTKARQVTSGAKQANESAEMRSQ